jgi:hypothetical protein
MRVQLDGVEAALRAMAVKVAAEMPRHRYRSRCAVGIDLRVALLAAEVNATDKGAHPALQVPVAAWQPHAEASMLAEADVGRADVRDVSRESVAAERAPGEGVVVERDRAAPSHLGFHTPGLWRLHGRELRGHELLCLGVRKEGGTGTLRLEADLVAVGPRGRQLRETGDLGRRRRRRCASGGQQ